MVSNSYQRHFDGLLSMLQGSNPYSKVLAYLVLRALLGRLSGKHQLDAAHCALQAMELQTVERMGTDVDKMDIVSTPPDIVWLMLMAFQFLNDTNLGSAAALKPRGRNTIHRLQAAILVMLPRILRPSGVTLDWIAKSDAVRLSCKNIFVEQASQAAYTDDR